MNILGKAIVEGKKILNAVSEKATPVVEETVKTVKEQSAVVTTKAKRAVDISVLKAEIEDLYTEFGKVTFEWGLMPSNEKALELMKVLYAKTEELEKLEAEVAAEKEAEKQAYIDSLLNFDTCEKCGKCKEEVDMDDETSVEDEIPVEPIQVGKKDVTEDKKVEVKPNKDTKKAKVKKSNVSSGKKSSGHNNSGKKNR